MSVRPAVVYLCLLLSFGPGCTALHNVKARLQSAGDIARESGLQERIINTGEFRLLSFHNGVAAHKMPLEVYIEGDGLAWRRKNRLSANPTPTDPVALRLAARVTGANLLYLARPCQYSDDVQDGRCSPRFWSSHRYAETVVNAMSRAIDDHLAYTGTARVRLIGYSGGGVIAALLAARRQDVQWLMTVAANLDIDAWTSLHQVTPLDGSLNPVDFASPLARLPQLHWTGARDHIVPEAVVRSYLQALGPNHMQQLHSVPDYTHDCCWVEDWPDLRRRALEVLLDSQLGKLR